MSTEIEPAPLQPNVLPPVDSMAKEPPTPEPMGEIKPSTPMTTVELAKDAAVAVPVLRVEEIAAETTKSKKPRKSEKKLMPKRRVARAAGGPVGQAAGNRGQAQSAASSAAYNSFAGRIAAHLRRYKRYPDDADRRRTRGTVRLVFTLSRDGGLRSVRLAGSSGHTTLDRAAIAMVRRAAPFPAFPPKLPRSTLTFTVPVRFKP